MLREAGGPSDRAISVQQAVAERSHGENPDKSKESPQETSPASSFPSLLRCWDENVLFFSPTPQRKVPVPSEEWLETSEHKL